MTSARGAIASVVDHVACAGATLTARRAAARWGVAEPALAGVASPAEAAAVCRVATPADQDVLLAGLVRLAGGDEWAALAAVAGLSRRLGWVVAGWARAGMAAGERAEAEAELVAACWAAIAACGPTTPARPGVALERGAQDAVRVGRRRQRRRQARVAPMPPDLVAGGPPALEALAGEVAGAVAGGRLALRPARALYLTRVAGYSTAEAGRLLGCDPGVLRVLRGRAARRLAA